jgi:hypothetical protein
VLPGFSAAQVALPLTGDRSCRACWAGLDAERRQPGLLSASLLDTRVVQPVGDAQGLCLRHVTAVEADDDTSPVLSRLVTQLRQAQWELDEDASKRAWDRLHEPKESEQGAWRRAPRSSTGRSAFTARWLTRSTLPLHPQERVEVPARIIRCGLRQQARDAEAARPDRWATRKAFGVP